MYSSIVTLTMTILSFYLQLENYFSSLKNPKLRVSFSRFLSKTQNKSTSLLPEFLSKRNLTQKGSEQAHWNSLFLLSNRK